MKKEEFRQAVDSIPVGEEARLRMYRRIEEKAAGRRPSAFGQFLRVLRVALPAAACFCLLLFGLFRLLPVEESPSWEGYTGVYSEVEDAAAFAGLSVLLDAPEGAQDVRYAILDEQVACVDFRLDGIRYTLHAWAENSTPSSAGVCLLTKQGSVAQDRTLDGTEDAHLITEQEGEQTCYKAMYQEKGVAYCLLSVDKHANEETLGSLARRLIRALKQS